MESMPKKRVCVTVREDLVTWIDEEIEKGIYASKSHAVERALILLREKKDVEKP
jgi:Arc/MetJ-type ribon-helix-helix transcriptional regulator